MKIAAATKRPERVAGMHFMNPVPLMLLVEGIRGLQTSDETFKEVRAVAEKMGKTFIEGRDMPGFIVNRILMPMINEAFFALYEGLGDAKSIDEAMKLGTNQPMGPLTLADYVGLDTCLAIQTGRALEKIVQGVMGLAAVLAEKAREHAQTPMIGRSHGIHAEPITAGLVFARWHAEVVRASSRLIRARHAIAVGKIAGAVGVYGNLDPEIERVALGKLGLEPETVATQIVQRDRHAEVLTALALLGTAIEQIALGIRHWQRTEVGEAEEGFGAGQKGSSAMPHKKNPVLSENLTGLARLLRSYAQAGMEDVALWHERDISHSSVERVAMPDATILADFMTARATGLVKGLVVHARRMRANLDRSGGLFFSEAVLLALVKTGLARQDAYVLVQKAALAAVSEAASMGHVGALPGRFRELLGQDPEVTARLDAKALDACFDLDHHLRHVPAILERALGAA